MRRCCNESWEAVKHLPDLVHLRLEYGSHVQLQALLAAPESNVTDLKVVVLSCGNPSLLDELLCTKLIRLTRRREELDQFLVLLRRLMSRSS